MTSTHRRGPRRALASAGALIIGFAGIAMLASPASADPIGDVGNIVAANSGQPGTGVVVHKYAKNNANGTAGTTGAQTGVLLPGAPGGADPIENALFTVTPVHYSGNPIDLLGNTGWEQAEDAHNTFNPATGLFSDANVSLGTPSAPVATSALGLAPFDGLAFGLYLVREVTPLPADVISPALPFLVTVPFPTGPVHPTNPNEWLYEVHAYPKNAVTGVTKDVLSTDVAFRTAGDFVSWTITSDVPLLAQGDSLTSFIVSDTVEDGELDFVTSGLPAGISDWSVEVLDASGNPVAVTAGTHYNITPASIVASTTTVDLTFTTAGLATLAANAQGGQVLFTVPTKVVAVPVGGVITNDAALQVNNANLTSFDSTTFGQLRVLKFAMTDVADVPTQTPLAGATFALYVDLNGDGIVDAGEIDPANLVTVDGATWTSGTDGLIDVPTLKVGHYFLVETSAPVGYQLNPTPQPVEITAGLSGDTPAVNYLEFENDQVPTWMLPFTGGNGVLTFTIIGAGLMALALGFALLAARRRKQAEQH